MQNKYLLVGSCLALLVGNAVFADPPANKVENVKAKDAEENGTPGVEKAFQHRKSKQSQDKSTKMEDKLPVSKMLNRQIKLAHRITNPTMQTALKLLNHAHVTLTPESFETIEHGDTSVVSTVDLMDMSNLLNATYRSLHQILKNSEYVSWCDAAKKAQVYTQLKSIQKDIKELIRSAHLSFDNADFTNQFVVLKDGLHESVGKINMAMHNPQFVKECSSVVHLKQYLEDTYYGFNVMLSRHLAQKAMDALRAAAESALGSLNSLGSVSASVSIPTPTGVDVGVGITIAADEGGGAEAFYQINKGQTLGVSVSVGKGIQAALSVEFSKTQSLIFQCLEQVLDYGGTIQKLTSPDVRELNSSRKSMQEAEQEYLRRQGELDGYLKILKVLPQQVVTLWTGITKSTQADERNVHGASLVESLSLGGFADISFKQTLETRKYTHNYNLLALIKEDCSASDLSLVQLQRMIGEKYVFHDLTEKFTPQVLCGFVEAYVGILEQLANPHATTPVKTLEQQKHEYEKLLLPRGAFPKMGHPGRLSILKAAILAAAELRLLSRSQETRILAARLNTPAGEDASNDERRVMVYDSVLADSEILFKKLYHQLSRLAKMQEFSKDSKRQASGEDIVEAINRILAAGATLTVPGIGQAQITVQRNHETFTNRGQERLGGNIELVVSTNAPIVYIWQQIQAAIRPFLARLEEAADTEDPNSERGRMISDYRQVLNGIVGVGFPIATLASVVPTGLSVTSTWHLVIPLKCVLPNTRQGLVPLPGEELVVRDQNCWVPQYLMTLIDRTTGLDVNASVAAISASATEQLQYVNFYEDCFTIWFTHFCSLYQGELYRKEADSKKTTAIVDLKKWQAWEGACQEQLKALQNLMTNLSNRTSNAYYELQDHYNQIVQNPELTPTVKSEIDQSVQKLLSACRAKKQEDVQSRLLEFLIFDYKYNKPLTVLQ